MIKFELNITNINQYEKAVKDNSFAKATVVRLFNLPGVTALPELPAATDVSLDNLPVVKQIKEYLKRKGWRML